MDAQIEQNIERMIPGVQNSFRAMLRARHRGNKREADRHRKLYESAQGNLNKMKQDFQVRQQKEAREKAAERSRPEEGDPDLGRLRQMAVAKVAKRTDQFA